jgi:transposase-like protein
VSTTEIMDTTLRVRRRHKSWPETLKPKIVAASLVPSASVSMVAQYDVNTNLVFAWRKHYGETHDPSDGSFSAVALPPQLRKRRSGRVSLAASPF